MIGLLGRALSTKLLGNGLQGMSFGVLWRLMDDCVFEAAPDTHSQRPRITNTALTSSPSPS